jgi:purine-cytosine permease-like protein
VSLVVQKSLSAWSKTSVTAGLECVVIKNVSFGMAGICVMSKLVASACLEFVSVQIVSFSIAGMCTCRGPVLASLKFVVIKINRF